MAYFKTTDMHIYIAEKSNRYSNVHLVYTSIITVNHLFNSR